MTVVGGFLVGFGTTLCRWLYIRPCHYGFIQSAMALTCCDHLFYDRWIYHGQSYSAIYTSLKIKNGNDFSKKTTCY